LQYETGLRVSEAYAHTQDSENQALELIPEHRLKLEDTVSIAKGWNGYLSYKYTGSRYSDNTATYTDEQNKPDDYHLLDAQIMHEVSEKTSLRIGIKNIFDEAYEWKYGYPAEGRSYYASLAWKL